MFGRERLERWRKVRESVDPQGVLWSEWLEERVGNGAQEKGMEVRREGRWEDVMGQSGWWGLW